MVDGGVEDMDPVTVIHLLTVTVLCKQSDLSLNAHHLFVFNHFDMIQCVPFIC